jgi:hypothetical protein
VKEAFRKINFRGKSKAKLIKIQELLDDYAADGIKVTLRQLYYRLVAAAMIPNDAGEYKRLSELINNAKYAGIIDWSAIVDLTRGLRGWYGSGSPADAIRSAALGYSIDLWGDQPTYVEVLVEKQALESVVEWICADVKVPFLACKGYTSGTTLYQAAQRYARIEQEGKEVHVIHIGDLDPSGWDMTRDIRERVTEFAGGVNLHRLALNMEQVEEFKPPPSPVKIKDSRHRSYIRMFGSSCWEADAMEPRLLKQLLTAEVLRHRDEDIWKASLARQEAERARILPFHTHFRELERYIQRKPDRELRRAERRARREADESAAWEEYRAREEAAAAQRAEREAERVREERERGGFEGWFTGGSE